jgi:hypothetical protein
LTVLSFVACQGEPPPEPEPHLSPRPLPDVVESLRLDLETPRHPADGGGRAWLDESGTTPAPIAAGSRARFTVVFEAGPLGVADGGMVFLQASPFWGWSTPQTLDPSLHGYTVVETDAEGVVLEAETLATQLLGVRITGRSLEPGERLTFVYGDGPAGARVDTYAEAESRIWVAVDGDGDGVRALLPDSPTVTISPAEPTSLLVTLPTTARPGQTVRLSLAIVDSAGNGGVPIEGTVLLAADGTGLDLPEQVEMTAADRGTLSLEIPTREAGLYRVTATTGDLTAISNPLFVTERLPRIVWGDLHGHSGLTDGSGTPDDYFRYARDVAALDVVALTDHDHWGMRPLSMFPEIWEAIRDTTNRFHEPGRLVTLVGYEWTNWLHGHRHVLYFDDDGEIFSSLDERYEHPEQLWERLRGTGALTFAHHSAGEPVPTNWSVAPDPELEPVTEVVSVHGSSEAADSPRLIRGAVPGNFVRDVLDRGYRLGLIGSGDSHDGHPGLAGLASPNSGLAGLMVEDLTREGVRDALARRAVYATSGPRILLHVALDGRLMGSDVPAPEHEALELVALAVTEEPIARIDVVRSGQVVESVQPDERTVLQRLSRQIEPLGPDEYLYVRVIQIDGNAAWSSPFFAASD